MRNHEQEEKENLVAFKIIGKNVTDVMKKDILRDHVKKSVVNRIIKKNAVSVVINRVILQEIVQKQEDLKRKTYSVKYVRRQITKRKTAIFEIENRSNKSKQIYETIIIVL